MVPRGNTRASWCLGKLKVSLGHASWQGQPPAHLLFCFPLTTPTPMPSKVFLVRKVTRPDSGHLYAMKVLKKATLKGEWGVPPRRASGWAEIEGR